MLEARTLTLGYNGQTLIAPFDFTLKAGQVTAVIGHNGAGKSTLARTVLGLQPPPSGQLYWTGGKPSHIAYIGQSNDLDHQFPMRVRDIVAMGVWRELGFWSAIDGIRSRRISEALARTGLAGMADRPLYECSSGQLQRCFFARAIAQDAPVLLLDEPFTAIDQKTEARLYEIIEEWREEGRAVLIILHDISSVLTLSDHCLLLGAGNAIFGETSQIITAENLIAYQYMTEKQAQFLTLSKAGGAGNV